MPVGGERWRREEGVEKENKKKKKEKKEKDVRLRLLLRPLHPTHHPPTHTHLPLLLVLPTILIIPTTIMVLRPIFVPARAAPRREVPAKVARVLFVNLLALHVVLQLRGEGLRAAALHRRRQPRLRLGMGGVHGRALRRVPARVQVLPTPHALSLPCIGVRAKPERLGRAGELRVLRERAQRRGRDRVLGRVGGGEGEVRRDGGFEGRAGDDALHGGHRHLARARQRLRASMRAERELSKRIGHAAPLSRAAKRVCVPGGRSGIVAGAAREQRGRGEPGVARRAVHVDAVRLHGAPVPARDGDAGVWVGGVRDRACGGVVCGVGGERLLVEGELREGVAGEVDEVAVVVLELQGRGLLLMCLLSLLMLLLLETMSALRGLRVRGVKRKSLLLLLMVLLLLLVLVLLLVLQLLGVRLLLLRPVRVRVGVGGRHPRTRRGQSERGGGQGRSESRTKKR